MVRDDKGNEIIIEFVDNLEKTIQNLEEVLYKAKEQMIKKKEVIIISENDTTLDILIFSYNDSSIDSCNYMSEDSSEALMIFLVGRDLQWQLPKQTGEEWPKPDFNFKGYQDKRKK
uniref:Uncharacterized protein n=1 Tax=Tanacetum cinerariifolium TaxID=118510 RepID=A0A6L2MJX2_TANCI|nr:hypothetical protein [Tanacetum cinerariifolium]